jgi:hypothetical protein
MRRATSFAGIRNRGSNAMEASVNCHDSTAIDPMTNSRVATLLRACENVDVNACCAPATSPTRRETSLPVFV